MIAFGFCKMFRVLEKKSSKQHVSTHTCDVIHRLLAIPQVYHPWVYMMGDAGAFVAL